METLLHKLVDAFGQDPLAAGKRMRDLLDGDRERFLSAAAAVLETSGKARGGQYLVTLLLRDDLLLECLCCDTILSREKALALAKAAARVEPRLDSKLMRRLFASEEAGGKSGGIAPGRLLEILPEISDSSTILPLLAQFLHHPDPHTRSKAALLAGRLSKDARLIARRLKEPDARVRANAIEALWDSGPEACLPVFRAALRDPNNRVVGNALIGLYLCGEVESIAGLFRMSAHDSAVFRLTAAWAMGHTGDPRFRPVLARSLGDSDHHVRQTALRALTRIRQNSARALEAGRLRVLISEARRMPDGSRQLQISVVSAEKQAAPALRPTHFVIWENGRLITDYQVEIRPVPECICVGFVLPQAGVAEAYRQTCVNAVLGCLPLKRQADRWAISKYQDNPGTQAREADPKIQPAELPKLDFLEDSAALGACLEGSSDGGFLAGGIREATARLMEASAPPNARRHAVLLGSPERTSGASSSVVDGDDLATAAQAAGIAIHGLMPAASGPSWLQEFCLKSQGCLRVSQRDEEFQGLLEDLYAGLLSSYQVAYRPANTQPPGASLELKVQVCSTQGYGEALSAIAIPAEPPSPEGGPA